MKADELLKQACKELAGREETYDSPGGERSMEKTVELFRVLTGISISVKLGWLFMVCLKLVRSLQGKHKDDNFVDGSAYMGLAGEASQEEQLAGNVGKLSGVRLATQREIDEARADYEKAREK